MKLLVMLFVLVLPASPWATQLEVIEPTFELLGEVDESVLVAAVNSNSANIDKLARNQLALWDRLEALESGEVSTVAAPIMPAFAAEILNKPIVSAPVCVNGVCGMPVTKTSPVVPVGFHAHRAFDGSVVVHHNSNNGVPGAHNGMSTVRIAEGGQTVRNSVSYRKPFRLFRRRR